jgi:hypothetical protein
MLLIGGKNLVPLVSAAVINSFGWRWVFIIVGIIVAVMFVLTYLCVPETCWDRTPLSSDLIHRKESRSSLPRDQVGTKKSAESTSSMDEKKSMNNSGGVMTPIPSTRVRFAAEAVPERPAMAIIISSDPEKGRRSKSEQTLTTLGTVHTSGLPVLHSASPAALDLATTNTPISRSGSHHSLPRIRSNHSLRRLERQEYAFEVPLQDIEPIPSAASQHSVASTPHEDNAVPDEEVEYRFRKKTYREMLAIYQGRISREKWWKAALRPFILYAYPAIAFVPFNLISLANGA